MDYELLIVFIILNIVNVIIQTVKSIATIKCGKGMASVVNAIAYGLYTVVVVYTVCDLPLWLKVVVVGLCNLVGVFCVKWGEERHARTSCGRLKPLLTRSIWTLSIEALVSLTVTLTLVLM